MMRSSGCEGGAQIQSHVARLGFVQGLYDQPQCACREMESRLAHPEKNSLKTASGLNNA